MSWNIDIYAERFDESQKTWQACSKKPIFTNYKYYKIDEYDSFSEMPISACTLKSLELNENYRVKYCDATEFITLNQDCVNHFIHSLQSVYKSLGLQLDIEYDNDVYESSYEEESSTDYVAQFFSLMTFPVSKNLFRDLSSEFNQAMRAKYMIGVVQSMIEFLGEEDNKIRLVFLTI